MVAAMQEQNKKAQRLGIEEEVIARGTTLPASTRAPDLAQRRP